MLLGQIQADACGGNTTMSLGGSLPPHLGTEEVEWLFSPTSRDEATSGFVRGIPWSAMPKTSFPVRSGWRAHMCLPGPGGPGLYTKAPHALAGTAPLPNHEKPRTDEKPQSSDAEQTWIPP